MSPPLLTSATTRSASYLRYSMTASRGPLDRRIAPRAIIEHVAAPLVVSAGDDQPGLVRFLATGHRRVDRDHDARQVRHALTCRPAQFFEQRARPQRPRHVIEDLGVELLPADPGALVFADNLGEERLRQIASVFVAAPARQPRRRICDQLTNDLGRLRRRRNDHPRIIAKPQPEHQHVPGVGIPPACQLVTPSRLMLRPTQSLWFVGTKGRRDRPVRPRYPTLGGLIPRPARRRPHREHATLALDHDIAHIGSRRPNQRYPCPAGLDLAADPFCPRAGFTKPTARQDQPSPPITGRRLLLTARQPAPFVRNRSQPVLWQASRCLFPHPRRQI